MERGPESLDYSQVESLLGDLHDYIPLLNNNEENINQLRFRDILSGITDEMLNNTNKYNNNELRYENFNLNLFRDRDIDSQPYINRERLDLSDDIPDLTFRIPGRIEYTPPNIDTISGLTERILTPSNDFEPISFEALLNTFSIRDSNINTAPTQVNLIPQDIFSTLIENMRRAGNSLINGEGIINEGQHRWSFRSNGLVVTGTTAYRDEEYMVADRIIEVKKGEEVARVDFMPGSRLSYNPNQMSDSIEKGAQGLQKLIEELANPNKQIGNPKVIIGSTNLRMALMTERLGFEIQNWEQYYTFDENGKRVFLVDLDKTLSVKVVGTVANIQSKSARIIELNRKIAERNLRRAGGNWNPLGSSAYLH